MKDISKYKRPVIGIEEYDTSGISAPMKRLKRLEKLEKLFGFKRTCAIWTATQSPMGPINNPIYIDNSQDFEAIFGKTTNFNI